MKILAQGIHEGDRNNSIVRICGHLVALPWSKNEAWFWLKLYNSAHVFPPLPESELRKTFNSVVKRDASSDFKVIEIMAEYGCSRKHALTILESME